MKIHLANLILICIVSGASCRSSIALKPSLNRVDGVSNVVVQGDQIPNFEITPEPSKLVAAGVTVSDVLNAIQLTNVIDSPGLLQTQHELVPGLIGAQVHDAGQLGQVVI